MRFSGEAQVTKYISRDLFPVHTNQRFDAEQKHFRHVAKSSSAIRERKKKVVFTDVKQQDHWPTLYPYKM